MQDCEDLIHTEQRFRTSHGVCRRALPQVWTLRVIMEVPNKDEAVDEAPSLTPIHGHMTNTGYIETAFRVLLPCVACMKVTGTIDQIGGGRQAMYYTSMHQPTISANPQDTNPLHPVVLHPIQRSEQTI